MCTAHHHHSSPLLVHIFPFSLPILLSVSFFFIAKPPVSLPSFSNFAKLSSPFFERALCPFIESFKRSKGWGEELPLMAEVAAQA